MVKQKTSASKKIRFLMTNLVLMVLTLFLVGYAVLYGLDFYTHHDESIVVPAVKGKTMMEAQILFAKQGLSCAITDSMYVKEEKPGRILEQNPSGNVRVKKGRKVYLTINTQRIPLRKVPDVAGNSSLRQAQAKLMAAGFKLLEEKIVAGEKEWVYGITYRDSLLKLGDKVPIGAELRLEVGDGSPVEPVDSISSDSLSIVAVDNSLGMDAAVGF